MEIVCTVGPSSLDRSTIRLLGCAGATIFRLNLSYVDLLNEIDDFLDMVKNETKGGHCIDTHGMKYRPPGSTPFTIFDENALQYGAERYVSSVAVSFAQDKDAILLARELSYNGTSIIAKIEDRIGLENKMEIVSAADVILIDREDLSKSVPIEDIPFHCSNIIYTCKELETPVWVAANLLESMTTKPQPTLAEVSDIASLLLQGVDGLVLAAETAIGKYPVQCVEFVRKMSERYKV